MRSHLPPLLMTSDPGSFARHTIVERKPQIIAQVMADNGYPDEIEAALDELRQEIAAYSIRSLVESAPGVDAWNREVAAFRGRTWLELPWYFAEAYFYRRLLEAVGYFQPGPRRDRDPFAVQKREQERQAVDWLAGGWEVLEAAAPEVRLEALLHSALWGNRADLSNYTVREQAVAGLAASRERHNLVIDDTDRAIALLAGGVARVDLITDNDGRELLFDLALADLLLAQGWVSAVEFHLKAHPFFVSDAMGRDVSALLALLRVGPGAALGRRLDDHLAAGRLALREHPFWTSWRMFRDLPRGLAATLEAADLVILKGDVNYRRLLGDRHWPPTARVEAIADYFPAPFLILRTLKGEIVAGLEPGQAEAIAAEDANWLIDGKRGIVQLVTPFKRKSEAL